MCLCRRSVLDEGGRKRPGGGGARETAMTTRDDTRKLWMGRHKITRGKRGKWWDGGSRMDSQIGKKIAGLGNIL